MPREHGGWGLTAEPALLGLIVAPSWAGAAIAVAAFIAFLVRTPVTVLLVDRRRGRWLPRTRLAASLAAGELAILLGLAAVALVLSGGAWLVPIAGAAPLVGVELWFDMRSRGRRLIPELAGATGIAAVAAAVALAGGAAASLSVGLWLILTARSVMALPFVRVQIDRLRHGTGHLSYSDLAQAAGCVVAAVGVAVAPATLAGGVLLVAIAALHTAWVRRPPVPAKVLGFRQLGLGLALVAVTAAGVIAT